MNPFISKLSIVVVGVLLTTSAYAKQFANQYCQFELPIGWECSLEGSEWVCQSTNKERRREAIIILAAKVRGSQDSLEEYLAYLKKTKTYTLPGGRTQVSEAKYAKKKTVNSHQWVDALHLASEVPGFYTRYLATVKSNLGVAITFSVGKEFYQSYQGIFDKVVATLRVFAQKNIKVGDFKIKKENENLLDDSTFIPEGDENFDISQRGKGGGGGGFGGKEAGILGAVVLGVGAFLASRGKKKKKKKK